eukprot:15482213-Alexandrium_andersonii.AAC.1
MMLEHWGLPRGILQLLADMWRRQVRWVTFGGAVHPTPLIGARALPQGDPFAPLALAAVLAP